MIRVELERVEALELLGMTLGHLNVVEARAERSPRVALLMAVRDQPALALRVEGRNLSYTNQDISAVTAAMAKYRGADEGEVGAALAVVGMSPERATKESRIRDDMIRVAHRAGASVRRLAQVSELGRKTVTVIISRNTEVER